MKIAVLGATGLTGLQFVLEALENEHEVFALVRNPDGLISFVKNDKLQVRRYINIYIVTFTLQFLACLIK